MNQKIKNTENAVELLNVDHEEMDLSAMTMQEITSAAVERGFKPQSYNWNYHDEMAAYRFLQPYDNHLQGAQA